MMNESEWPPVNSKKLNHEKDSIYLTLVDMFVEVVEPSIIQMVLQNRNWDMDSAIEDIMILSNTTGEKPLNTPNTGTPENNINISQAIHHHGFESFKAKMVGEDHGSRKVIPQATSGTINKSSVKEEFHAEKKYSPPDSNQSCVKALSDRNRTSEIDLSDFTNSYNYVKAMPDPYERSVLLVRNGVKLMIILRGPPGSGKSYLSKKLLNEVGIDQPMHKKHIFSTDDFFIQNNVYVFDPNLLSEAHMFNQRNVLAAVKKHVSPIIVDNTNTQAWEMRVYADLAVSAGYDVEIVEPSNWWLFKENELSRRNVHGINKAKIRNMVERYEKHITPKRLMQKFELQYSLNNAPPQPVLNLKWKDKLRSFKSNRPKKKKQEMCPQLQAHSSKGNLTNVLPTMSLKPHEFMDNPNLQSSLSCPTPSLPSTSAYRFTNVSNGLVQKSPSPQNINKVHLFSDLDYSKKLFSNENKKPKSPTPINISEPVLNRINTHHSSMVNPIQAYTPSSSGGSHNKRLPSNLEKGENSNDSIGFESHKPAAIGKTLSEDPIMGLDSFTFFNTKNEGFHLACDSDINIESSKVLSPEVCNVEETKEDKVLELCQTDTKVEHLGNLGEKELVAIELVNSLIDTVVTTERKSLVSHKEANKMDHKANFMNDLDGFWDYVVVTSNNTFIYKNLNSVPISSSSLDVSSAISKETGNSVTCAHFMKQKSKGCCKTDFQTTETPSNNENSMSHNDNSLVQANFDLRNQPTVLLVDTIHTQDNILNPDSSEKHLMAFSSDEFVLRVDNSKEITLKDPKETKEYQKHTLKMDSHKFISLDKEDTNIEECTAPIYSEAKIEAMGIMETILSSMTPCSLNSKTSVDTEVSCKEDTDAYMLVNCSSPDDWSRENTDKISNTFEKAKPKPARQLARPKLVANYDNIVLNQHNTSSSFGFWDTTTNAVENWDSRENKTKYELPKEGPVSLPQRLRSNKHLNDSSTNTNYHDFLSVSQQSPAEAKVLIGIGREIAAGCYKSTLGVSQTLLLDKSTMTKENTSDAVNNLDLSQINILFPHIPESYILDMVEKCQGDFDWAVDLLLDSEHSIYHFHNGSKESGSASSFIGHEVSEANIFKENEQYEETQNPKLVRKTPNSINENFELKKAIESSVVLNKSHYSNQVLKVLKKKNPEYLNLIEGKHVEPDECFKDSEISTLAHDSIPGQPLETNSSDEENITICPVRRQEEDDDTLELIVNYDLVLQLQQKFGNSSTPKIMNMTPLVKLPVSLARQLYGYMMDSLQTEVDEQQDAIESMIAKDEEIAKMLQYEDQNLKPKLQEIMDMEVALAVHKADQEERGERSNNTVAAKLSTNILLEKFPQIDQKVLIDMLHTHNYSLHDTVNSLKLALEVEDDRKHELKECNTAASLARLDQNKDAKGSHTVEGESVDPLNEAQSYRQDAATYYSMRIECLRKAHEAYRSGNKPVASYYSHLAQLHKQKVEQCNSAAASCLLSTHKAGNTLDLHFLHITEAEVVLDMFLDEIINYISGRRKRYQTVFLITGRGLRSLGGVSRIKPMAIKKLQSRKVLYNEVNPGMLSALIRIDTPLSYTS